MASGLGRRVVPKLLTKGCDFRQLPSVSCDRYRADNHCDAVAREEVRDATRFGDGRTCPGSVSSIGFRRERLR